MYKMINRIVASICLLALFFQFVIPAQAYNGQNSSVCSDTSDINNFEIDKIDDNYFCLFSSSAQNVVIIYDNKSGIMNGSISFTEKENYVYQFIWNDIPVTNFDVNNNTSWYNIVEYMKQNLNEAQIIEFEIEEENLNLSNTRSSVTADLKPQLISLVGSEYSNVDKYSTSYNGCSMKIVENMQLQITLKKTFTWKSAITVSSFIVTYLGMDVTTSLVKKICSVFDVAATASSLIPNGSAKKYLCRAIISRWTYVNNIASPCNTTTKYYDYYGLDDEDLNSTVRAQIYTGRTTSYSDSASYFGNYSQQISDAYNYYLSYY